MTLPPPGRASKSTNAKRVIRNYSCGPCWLYLSCKSPGHCRLWCAPYWRESVKSGRSATTSTTRGKLCPSRAESRLGLKRTADGAGDFFFYFGDNRARGPRQRHHLVTIAHYVTVVSVRNTQKSLYRPTCRLFHSVISFAVLYCVSPVYFLVISISSSLHAQF